MGRMRGFPHGVVPATTAIIFLAVALIVALTLIKMVKKP
ncbi:MAG TPA: FeoB-associated Cys-rich membrane protein [Streptosporangiaceae bacterium]|nr:FeoB-associated Cys-rich membrane protein [Streptosporangiaceae bacterium]